MVNVRSVLTAVICTSIIWHIADAAVQPVLHAFPDYPLYTIGENVTLVCKIPEGKGNENFTFFKDSFQISTQNGPDYFIQSLDYISVGTYNCENTDNNTISLRSHTIPIHVYGPLPSPSITLSPSYPECTTGQLVTLMCSTTGGYAFRQFTFFKDGQIMCSDTLNYTADGQIASRVTRNKTAVCKICVYPYEAAGDYSCGYRLKIFDRWVDSFASGVVTLSVSAGTEMAPTTQISLISTREIAMEETSMYTSSVRNDKEETTMSISLFTQTFQGSAVITPTSMTTASQTAVLEKTNDSEPKISAENNPTSPIASASSAFTMLDNWDITESQKNQPRDIANSGLPLFWIYCIFGGCGFIIFCLLAVILLRWIAAFKKRKRQGTAPAPLWISCESLDQLNNCPKKKSAQLVLPVMEEKKEEPHIYAEIDTCQPPTNKTIISPICPSAKGFSIDMPILNDVTYSTTQSCDPLPTIYETRLTDKPKNIPNKLIMLQNRNKE